MEAMHNTKKQEISYTLDDAMNVLFFKLDEAIDDVQNGRLISEEELWAEIDAIQYEERMSRKIQILKFMLTTA